MITTDDNAKKNYERVKRWREKNRALVNLKQRNYRREKKNLPVDVQPETGVVGCEKPEVGEARESKAGKPPDAHSKPRLGSRGGQNDLGSGLSGGNEVADVMHSLPPAQTPRDSTLEYLKGLERAEREKTRVEAPADLPAKFGTYRDDGGRPITERAWNELQKKKERAEKGGYVYDEFSQA